MPGGIIGKILKVDLSLGRTTEEEFPDHFLEKYGAGDGLAARLIYDEVPPGVGAFDPQSILVVSAGTLGGTTVQASCNCSIAAKSPLTGFTIYNSHCNGSFARMLKFSGYDAIVVKGQADRPVFLWIHEGKAEIKDAASVWGKDTWETEEILKRDLQQPKLSSMSIGPAGENLVLLSGIVTDKLHIAGRGGLGAVMGSKKLKTIAVYGNKKVPVVQEERFKELSQKWREINMEQLPTQSISKFGTAGNVNAVYAIGDMPIKNWSQGTLEGWEKLSGEYIVGNMLKRHTTCPGCTIAHTKILDLQGGAFSGECAMPEYEIVVAMGSNIGVTDPTVAAKGGELLNKWGLDGLGVSNVIGFAMECYEKGLISKEDADGLDLKFGNYEAAFKMVEKIATRDGFGDILADGPVRAADYIGKESQKFAVHVKGMPIVFHDHRALWGFALQYAVGSAGPAHEGGPLFAEMSGMVPRFSVKGKAKLVKDGQEWRSFINTLGLCQFGAVGVSQALVAETVSAATGFNIDANSACILGRRLINLRRAFNIRHGLKPEDDTLPYRYVSDPPPDGGAKGSTVPIKPMVHDYYNLMGWDLKSGKPYRRTLEELGLGDVAVDLWGS
jgi:aldehyde:ferredoxin oxidoreductase